jgi:hypothetical protein
MDDSVIGYLLPLMRARHAAPLRVGDVAPPQVGDVAPPQVGDVPRAVRRFGLVSLRQARLPQGAGVGQARSLLRRYLAGRRSPSSGRDRGRAGLAFKPAGRTPPLRAPLHVRKR